MAKPKKTENNQSAPDSQQVIDGKTVETRPLKYVVLRAGYRVSDREYSDPNDPAAISERNFWDRVEKKDFGKPVEIVVFDSKRHRVW